MGLFFLCWYQLPYSIFCWGSKTRFHRKFYDFRIPLKMLMKVMLDNRLLSSCKTLLQCAEANSFLIFCGMYNYVCSKGRHSCIAYLVMWPDLFIQYITGVLYWYLTSPYSFRENYYFLTVESVKIFIYTKSLFNAKDWFT